MITRLQLLFSAVVITVTHPSIAHVFSLNTGESEKGRRLHLQPDWSILEASLLNSTLYGPTIESVYQNCSIYDDARTRSKALNGVCMQSFECGYKFCNSDRYEHNLPMYTLDVKSEPDLVQAMVFALNYSIPVSVKTTGYSLQGSSTARDSLLIWMHNFPKDDEIKSRYTDSCGNLYDKVIGIGGGETWNDVLEVIQGDYNIVSASETSVSAAGGWVQGGGIALNSRLYGLGIDNVVDFRVVLADGSIVIANECTNTDLFWALRGGGGGTYGIVTHIHYRLYEPTPIVQINFVIYGRTKLEVQDLKPYSRALFQFLNFWMAKSGTLDKRWCGGHFSQNYVHLLFCGSMLDAKATFLDDFVLWESNILIKTGMRPGIWGSLFSTNVYSNWYEYIHGGVSSRIAAVSDDYNMNIYNQTEDLSVRLVPLSEVQSNPSSIVQLLLSNKVTDSSFGLSNYYIGGAINDIAASETSIHPAMRKSIFNFSTKGQVASDTVRDQFPNSVTGVDYNHHYVLEPDWRQACWGYNYNLLRLVKNKYDPARLLNCWHCVSYIGDEIPARYTFQPSSSPSNQPSSSPSDQFSLLPSSIPSVSPSKFPSNIPSNLASSSPSIFLSRAPSNKPSVIASKFPSKIPSHGPSSYPSNYPSSYPSSYPSNYPSNYPSSYPSTDPSNYPSTDPSSHPSTDPSSHPSTDPSSHPFSDPSSHPSGGPSNYPSPYPSNAPTLSQSNDPSNNPISTPTYEPSISTTPSAIQSQSPSSEPSISILPSAVLSSSPTNGRQPQNPYSNFLLKITKIDTGVSVIEVRKCKWLAKKSIKAKRRICTLGKHQRFSEQDNLAPASRTCYDTCASFCVRELSSAKFIFGTQIKDGKTAAATKQCKWLARKDDARIAEICTQKIIYDGLIYGQASEICTNTCNSCTK